MGSLVKDGLEYCEVKPEEYDRFIDYLKHIKEENNSHDAATFSRAAWEWQYLTLPSMESRFFAVKKDNEILGSYHFLIYPAWVFGERIRLLTIQDVSVSSKLRGRGVFKTLSVHTVNEVLKSEVDAVYAFPNQRSYRTYVKYNRFTVMKNLPVYISPISPGRIIRRKIKVPGLETLLDVLVNGLLFSRKAKKNKQATIQQHDEVTDDIAEVFYLYQSKQKIVLERNKEYLDWRFLQKPDAKHYIFSLKEDNLIQAVVVFKMDEMFAIPCLALMDFACRSDETHILQLIDEIKRNPDHFMADQVDMVFTAGTGSLFERLKRIGFFQVPERFVPRPIVLTGQNNRLTCEEDYMNPVNWHITLSDWDVF